jgi:hypothetical protein
MKVLSHPNPTKQEDWYGQELGGSTAHVTRFFTLTCENEENIRPAYYEPITYIYFPYNRVHLAYMISGKQGLSDNRK